MCSQKSAGRDDGMVDIGDLKSPDRTGRAGSSPVLGNPGFSRDFFCPNGFPIPLKAKKNAPKNYRCFSTRINKKLETYFIWLNRPAISFLHSRRLSLSSHSIVLRIEKCLKS